MTLMSTQVEWHGTQAEHEALEAAVDRHCTCQDGQPCSLHRMLHEDQHALDRLLFMRRLAERLNDQEMTTP
jgi:hypothetical protein